MTDETRWYATHPVAGFAAIREVGTDRVIFAVSAPGTEYGDPPMTDEEKTENLALAASAPEQAATIARLEREREELRDWIRAANGFAWSHERECPRYADREAECSCGLHQFLSRPRPYMESLKADAEALRALAALVTDGRMVHDVVRSTESGMYFINCFAPHDKTTRRKVTGTGATLAAAIMDALKKAG